MEHKVTITPDLTARIKCGLFREVYHRGLITRGQFAQLMEQQRGR